MTAWVRLAAVWLALATSAAATEVNSASQAELESIKGIGVALSQRLLDERQRMPFKDWADLMARVPGIGSRAAVRLSEQGLTVQGQPLRAEPKR